MNNRGGPMNDLFANVNEMVSLGLLVLLVYAQVNYHMTTYMKKIVEDSQTLRQNTLMMTKENNTVIHSMRDNLMVESERIKSLIELHEALQERLESLESTFKQLASAESALLNETISHLRVVEASSWNKETKAKIQKQIDYASQRNTLLENAAAWQSVPKE
jgi:DNA repair exonuclease SbcCD ATPase subunit